MTSASLGTDAFGVDVIWDIDIPRENLQELSPGTYQAFDVLMNVPRPGACWCVHRRFAGLLRGGLSRCQRSDTRIRDTVTLTVTVDEFHDMQISMDPTVDNAVKTSAPGRIVRFTFNVTNNGNVADVPTLNNHTAQATATHSWNELLGMNVLSSWDVDWFIMRQVSAELVVEEACMVMQSTASSFPEDACLPRRP